MQDTYVIYVCCLNCTGAGVVYVDIRFEL
jgi:hypothetical protein